MPPFISSPNRTKQIRELDHTSQPAPVRQQLSGEQPHQEGEKETMTSSYSAPLLLVLAQLAAVQAAPSAAAAAATPADTVADSCDAIRDFVDYAFCASALRSGGGPDASRADRHAHLLVAADLAAARGASARDAAQAMARSERDTAARDGLEACGILYGATSVPALRFMRGYAAARAWDRARSLLSLTGQAGIGCEAALEGAPEAKGRMAAANREFDQLSTMATALLNKVDQIG